MKISNLMTTSLMALTFSLPTFANEQICAEDINYQEKIMQHKNSMSFRNHGGLVNGGVCWWHSRWHRNATYLAYFSPEKAKPEFKYKKDRTQAGAQGLSVKEIVKRIKGGDKVVEIPGYNNLYEFTRENYKLIQDTLEAWQREDGFINQKWIVGLLGGTKSSPKKMEKRMKKLYKQVQNGEIVYQKLQMAGIEAHAWLVTGMEDNGNGYDLKVVDSNYPGTTRSFTYHKGTKGLNSWGYGNFVPYTGNRGEERGLKKAIRKYCKKLKKATEQQMRIEN